MDSTNNSTLNPNPSAGVTSATPKFEGFGGAQTSMSGVPPVSAMPQVNSAPLHSVGNTPLTTPAQPVAGTVGNPLATPYSQPVSVPLRPIIPRPPVSTSTPVAGVSNQATRPTNMDGVNSLASRNVTAPVPTDEMAGLSLKEGETLSGNMEVANEMENTALTEESFVAADSQQTPSVSFADPATQAEVNTSTQNVVGRKKSNKTVLMVLSIIAFLIAVALAVVLVMVVMGVGPFASV